MNPADKIIKDVRELKIKKKRKAKAEKNQQAETHVLKQIAKSLPTKVVDGEAQPRTWYQMRINASDRINQLKGLYKTYNAVAKIQKLFLEQGKGKWQNFPASLITQLSELEAMPSDELITLILSEK